MSLRYRQYEAGGLLPVVLIGFLLSGVTARAQNQTPLHQSQRITVPHVRGRIDHMAVDLARHRLFIAALENDSLEVIDSAAGVHIHTIKGLAEPQGVVFVPELNRIFVTNGRDGSCQIFDGRSFEPIGKISFSQDADNIRYDPHDNQVYVGYGSGALGRVDPGVGKKTGDVKLLGHPESFQLEVAGSRVFVNVPTVSRVTVIDRETSMVIATWPVEGAVGNFAMALDEASHRLFIACREPAKVIIFNTETGKITGSFEIARDADDIFFDVKHGRLYVSCGEGFLYVFKCIGEDGCQLQTKLATAKGARTSLFVPEQGRLYLAVPHRGKQDAEIWVYAVSNAQSY